MLFNSYEFLFLFLPITYTVFWLLRSARARYVWLAVTGYIFYGYWDPRFCLLMAFSTLVSYCAGLVLLNCDRASTRRLALVVPIAVDLSLLGFFKYANFAMASAGAISRVAGFPISPPHLNIILPVGISFYTFHTITYIVDSYRRIIRPTRNLFEFAAYVSLFSQLVAGPIVRFRQIETDLECLGSADRTRWLARGISLFVTGLIEKVVVADTLSAVVDPALAGYHQLSSAGAWAAMIGHTLQLYFDFSGYSDMAVGLGLMFGLRIPWNFDSPYKALDPSDFWKRWHISLSSCLRDYLYIPLGGNRGTEFATYRNLMLTMLIGGLWHGASWTFVVWGAYHGLLLSAYRVCRSQWDALPTWTRQAAMFVLVVVGWVLFRSTDFSRAASVLHTVFIPTTGVFAPYAVLFVVLLVIAGTWVLFGPNARELHDSFEWRVRYGFPLATAFGVVLALIAGGGASPFLYFQF